jgi:Ino eighty subunit 1
LSLLIDSILQPLASVHFDAPLNFLDLFLPINISSPSRARAFLWLMFHYLEGPDLSNPFDDEYSRQNPGKVPWLHRINEAEMQRENVDTEEEIQWGITMSGQRDAFLQRLMTSIDAEKKAKPLATVNPTKGSFLPSSLLSTTHSNDRTISEVNYHRLRQRHLPNGEREKPFLHYVPPTRDQQQQQAEPERRRGLLIFLTIMHLSHKSEPDYAPRTNRTRRSQSGPSVPQAERRNLLQRMCIVCLTVPHSHSHTDAWQVVSTADPLIDSDDEMVDDAEHVRRDYCKWFDTSA